MAYVQIPKDLSMVKSRVVGVFTKRQVIFFPLAGLVAYGVHTVASPWAGSMSMVLVMLAAFPILFLSHQNGELAPEKKLLLMLRHSWAYPQIRTYRKEKTMKPKEVQTHASKPKPRSNQATRKKATPKIISPHDKGRKNQIPVKRNPRTRS